MSYTDGYDAGLEDGHRGRPRRWARLRLATGASPIRRGYDDGYADGSIDRAHQAQPTCTCTVCAGPGPCGVETVDLSTRPICTACRMGEHRVDAPKDSR